MQDDPSGVSGGNPGEKRWGLCLGSESGRHWKRSCSKYGLEAEPSGFTFEMWATEREQISPPLFFWSENWFVVIYGDGKGWRE